MVTQYTLEAKQLFNQWIPTGGTDVTGIWVGVCDSGKIEKNDFLTHKSSSDSASSLSQSQSSLSSIMSQFCMKCPPAPTNKSNGGVTWTNSGRRRQRIDQRRVSQQCHRGYVLGELLRTHFLCRVRQESNPYHSAPFRPVMDSHAKEVSKDPYGVWSENKRQKPSAVWLNYKNATHSYSALVNWPQISALAERKEKRGWRTTPEMIVMSFACEGKCDLENVCVEFCSTSYDWTVWNFWCGVIKNKVNYGRKTERFEIFATVWNFWCDVIKNKVNFWIVTWNQESIWNRAQFGAIS
jgi:hypothetical protein